MPCSGSAGFQVGCWRPQRRPPTQPMGGRAAGCGLRHPECAGAVASLVSSWGSYPGLGRPGEGLSEVQALGDRPGKQRLRKNLKGDTRNAECKMHPSGGARRWACAPEEIRSPRGTAWDTLAPGLNCREAHRRAAAQQDHTTGSSLWNWMGREQGATTSPKTPTGTLFNAFFKFTGWSWR